MKEVSISSVSSTSSTKSTERENKTKKEKLKSAIYPEKQPEVTTKNQTMPASSKTVTNFYRYIV